MFEAKPTNFQPEYKSKERIRLESIFSKFPNTFEIERKKLLPFQIYTSEITRNGSEEFNIIHTIINQKAKKGGFDGIVTDPDDALPQTYVPFNILSIPLDYYEPIDTLAFKFNRDEVKTKIFIEKGLELMVEGHRQLFEGNTFEKFIDFYSKEEELSKATNIRDYEIIKDEMLVLNIGLSHSALTQLVNKIKSDKKRDIVDDIATVETFMTILHNKDVIRTLDIDNEKFRSGMLYRYSGTILDEKTINNIADRSAKIRNDLKEAY